MTNSPEFPTAIICARNPYCNYRDLSYKQKIILPACQECIARWQWQQKNNSTTQTSQPDIQKIDNQDNQTTS